MSGYNPFVAYGAAEDDYENANANMDHQPTQAGHHGFGVASTRYHDGYGLDNQYVPTRPNPRLWHNDFGLDLDPSRHLDLSDSAAGGGLHGSRMIGDEGQLYGQSIQYNLPPAQELQHHRSFDVQFTPELFHALGPHRAEILSYFNSSTNARASLVITHGDPRERNRQRSIQSSTNLAPARTLARNTGLSSTGIPKHPRRMYDSDDDEDDDNDDDDTASFAVPSRKRVKQEVPSPSPALNRSAPIPSALNNPRRASQRIRAQAAHATGLAAQPNLPTIPNQQAMPTLLAGPRVSPRCNIPGFVQSAAYTSPTVHLNGYSLQRLPPVCGTIVVSTTAGKPVEKLRDANGNVIHGPGGDALLRVDANFPDQISSEHEDTWKVAALMATYPNVPIAQFRARMIWSKGISALNNRLTAFRRQYGMFSPSESCQRAAPSTDLVIVHALNTDQLNRNTGWVLSSDRNRMSQPGGDQTVWYNVPWAAANFLQHDNARRINSALTLIGQYRLQLRAAGRQETLENILACVPAVNRGPRN